MTTAPTSITKTLVVQASVAHAFKVFTERFDSWWPRGHHIGTSEPFTVILEEREGGRWYERGADGSECDWGRVLLYAPPARVAVSWHLNIDFKYDPDPAKASRVEVSFFDEGGGKTRVELVHSGLDRHGEGWEKLRAGVDSQGGWGGILDDFAKSVG